MDREKKFVAMMLERAKQSGKIVPESKVDLSEVEQLTESIKKRIQTGELKIDRE